MILCERASRTFFSQALQKALSRDEHKFNYEVHKNGLFNMLSEL